MILGKIKTWWKHLRRRHRFARVLLVESMTAVPAGAGADIYIVRRGGLDRRAVLSCPCRCGRRIDVSLVPSENAYWTAQLKNGGISLYPSIWLCADPCKSHFFVRDSKVVWV
jgi:hypothetical protein